jgi:hypothetical protein
MEEWNIAMSQLLAKNKHILENVSHLESMRDETGKIWCQTLSSIEFSTSTLQFHYTREEGRELRKREA